MRSTSIGWIFVTAWAMACVVLALAIIAVTMLS